MNASLPADDLAQAGTVPLACAPLLYPGSFVLFTLTSSSAVTQGARVSYTSVSLGGARRVSSAQGQTGAGSVAVAYFTDESIHEPGWNPVVAGLVSIDALTADGAVDPRYRAACQIFVPGPDNGAQMFTVACSLEQTGGGGGSACSCGPSLSCGAGTNCEIQHYPLPGTPPVYTCQAWGCTTCPCAGAPGGGRCSEDPATGCVDVTYDYP